MIRRIALTVLLTVWTYATLLSGAALAADDQVAVDNSLHQVQVLSVLIGTVLPLAVGLVTKVVTSERVKALLLALFSAITAFVTEAINVGGFNDQFGWMAATLTALLTFVTAVGVHYGFWKPTGVAASAQATLVK